METMIKVGDDVRKDLALMKIQLDKKSYNEVIKHIIAERSD